MMDTMSEPVAAGVTVSARAAARIAEIIAAENEAKVLRLSVEGGGCTGFQYKFDLVPLAAIDPADDSLIERDGARVVVDSVSMPFLAGSELDFVDELIGAAFKVHNPNAVAACGCGTSFSV